MDSALPPQLAAEFEAMLFTPLFASLERETPFGAQEWARIFARALEEGRR